jgi:hypothetical protein
MIEDYSMGEAVDVVERLQSMEPQRVARMTQWMCQGSRLPESNSSGLCGSVHLVWHATGVDPNVLREC